MSLECQMRIKNGSKIFHSGTFRNLVQPSRLTVKFSYKCPYLAGLTISTSAFIILTMKIDTVFANVDTKGKHIDRKKPHQVEIITCDAAHCRETRSD